MDVTKPRVDTNFVFEYWHYFSWVSEAKLRRMFQLHTKTKEFLYPEKEKHNRRVNKHGWHDEIIIFACKDIKSTLTASNEDKTLSKQDKF